MDADVKGLPFDGGKRRSTRYVRIRTIQVSEPVQPPSDDTHQGDEPFETISDLQTAVSNGAAGFDDFVKDFDLPATAVLTDDLLAIIEIVEGGIGE